MISATQQEGLHITRLGRLCGAEVNLDRSCWFMMASTLAVVLLVAKGLFHLATIDSVVLAAASAVLLLCINFVHEAGHVIVGAHLSLQPKEMLLLGWGAKTTYDREVHKASDLFLVSIAGPGGNLAVAALAGAMIPFLGTDGPGLIAVLYCVINLAYAGINLAPLYPRDGGRLVYSCLWRLMRDEHASETLSRQLGLALSMSTLIFFAAHADLTVCLFVLVLSGETLWHDLSAMLHFKHLSLQAVRSRSPQEL